MKEKLDISTGGEATADEVEIIERAFSGNFEVTIHKTIYRFSEDELPLIIAFSLNLASSVSWDFIKLSVQSLFNLLPPRKAQKATVEIHLHQKNVIIGQNKVLIINLATGETPQEEFYDSIEKAFEILKDENKKLKRTRSNNSFNRTRK
jgi:ribosome-associated translation inhibitor RaiA